MLNISVQISGDKETLAKIKKLGNNLTGDFRPVLEKIGEQMVQYYSNDVFNAKGGMYGSAWAPLAASTIKEEQAKAKGGLLPAKYARTVGSTPLILTGTMKDSFTAKASGNSLQIGNSAPYFVYHQSNAPRHHLPRRQMLGITPTIKNIIVNDIKADIKAKIDAALL